MIFETRKNLRVYALTTMSIFLLASIWFHPSPWLMIFSVVLFLLAIHAYTSKIKEDTSQCLEPDSAQDQYQESFHSEWHENTRTGKDIGSCWQKSHNHI